MSFINWGHESEEQKKFRKFLDEESLMEQAINASQGRSGNAPGVGGGSLLYKTQASPSDQTSITIFYELNQPNYTYYVSNYGTATITGPFDTGVSVEDYSLDDLTAHTILYGGYGFRFYRGDINEHTMLFLDKDGMVVESIVAISTDVDMNDHEGKFIVATDYDENLLWIFDGTSVLTDTTVFSGTGGFSTGSNDDSAIPSGFGISTNTNVNDGDTLRKYYLCNSNSVTQIYEHTQTDENNEYVEFHLYNELDKLVVLTRNASNSNLKKIEVISNAGETEVSETININLPQFNYEFFGENNFFIHLRNGDDQSVPHRVYCYDGLTGQIFIDYFDAEIFTSWDYEFYSRSNGSSYNYAAINTMSIVFYNQISSINGFRETEDCMIYSKFAGFDPMVHIFADGDAKKIYLSDTGRNKNFLLFAVDANNDNQMSSLVLRPGAEWLDDILTSLGHDITNLDDIDVTANGEKIVLVIEYDDEELPVNTIIHSFNSSGAKASGVLELATASHSTVTAYNTYVVNAQNGFAYFLTPSGNWSEYEYLDNNSTAGFYVNLQETGAPYFATWGATTVRYTHTQMADDPDGGSAPEDFIMDGSISSGASYFGAGSSYFTNHYPGLFTLVAKSIAIASFTIDGGIGADGGGSVVTDIVPITGYSKDYTAYIKKVYDSGDPSINQIIIIDTDGTGVEQSADLTSEDDFHEITGIGSATEIHYLLFATAEGSAMVTEEQIELVIGEYLDLVDGQNLATTLSTLNTSYGNITGVFPEYDSVHPDRIYYFSDSGNNDISDGGDDMYDGANVITTNSIFGIDFRVFKENGQVSSFSVPVFVNFEFGRNGMFLLSENPISGDLIIRQYDLSGNLLSLIDTAQPDFANAQYIEDRGILISTEKIIDEEVYGVYRLYLISPNGTDSVTVNVPIGGPTNRFVIYNDYGRWND